MNDDTLLLLAQAMQSVRHECDYRLHALTQLQSAWLAATNAWGTGSSERSNDRWKDVARHAQGVIEHSRTFSDEMAIACRLKELAMDKGGLVPAPAVTTG